MRSDLCLEPTAVTHTLDNPRNISSAVEHVHFLGYADIRVDERIVVCDHVLVGRLRRHRVLQRIGRTLEEQAPEGPVDQMQQWQDTKRAVWRRGRGRRGREGGGRRTRY